MRHVIFRVTTVARKSSKVNVLHHIGFGAKIGLCKYTGKQTRVRVGCGGVGAGFLHVQQPSQGEGAVSTQYVSGLVAGSLEVQLLFVESLTRSDFAFLFECRCTFFFPLHQHAGDGRL